MLSVCKTCVGPAITHEVVIDGVKVEVTQCVDCDCPKCSVCKVPVVNRYATKCPMGHVL